MNRGLTRFAYASCFVGLVLTLNLVLGPFRIYTIDIFLAWLIACIGFHVVSGHQDLQFQWKRIDYTVLVILACVSLSTALSENIYRSTVPLCDWIRVTILWFSSRALGGSRVSTKFMARWSLWLAIALLFAGLIEKATGTAYLLIGNYFGGSTEQDISMVNYGANQQARRISGTTTNPNVYSQWVIIFSSIGSIHLYWKRQYTYCVALCAISAFIVLLTASRASIIGIVISAMVFTWLIREQLGQLLLRVLLLFGFALIGGIWIADEVEIGRSLDIVYERFDRELGRESLRRSSRVIVAQMGIELMQRSPKNFFFGVGGDNFFPAYAKKAARATRKDPRSGVHNVWLKAATEYGFLTCLALMFFFFDALRHAYSFSRARTGSTTAFWGQCLLVILIPYVLILSQAYESSLMYHIIIPVFCIIGFAVSVDQRRKLSIVYRQQVQPSIGQDASLEAVRAGFSP